jgi:hypothetical protein
MRSAPLGDTTNGQKMNKRHAVQGDSYAKIVFNFNFLAPLCAIVKIAYLASRIICSCYLCGRLRLGGPQAGR